MPLILGVDADTKKATSKIKSASKSAGTSVKQLEQKSVSSASKIKTAFSALGPVIGALGFAVVLRGLKSLVTETITFRDEIAKFSRATGTSVEFLSAIGFAAERSGANVDSMGKAFGRLARNISDAARGLVTPLEAFEVLDINIKNVDGSLKNLEDIFPEIADGFKNLTDDTRKAALAQELFGRAGIELIPLLEEGREGIKALTDEAARLGIVFGEEAAIEAEAAADAITGFNTAVTAVSQNIASSALPSLTAMAENITNVIAAASDPEGKFAKFIAQIKSGFTPADFEEEIARLRAMEEALANPPVDDIKRGNEATQEFLDLMATIPPNAPDVPFVNVPNEEMELLLPPMEEVIAGLGEAKSLTQQWLELQESLALEIPKLPDVLSLVDQRIKSISLGVENITRQLILGVIHGRSLAKIMKSVLENFVASGLASFLGQLAARFVSSLIPGSPASLPGIGDTSIAKTGINAPLGITSGAGLSSVPAISTTNNNNGVTINLSVTTNSFDRLFVETDLAPMLEKKVRQGRINLTATDIR